MKQPPPEMASGSFGLSPFAMLSTAFVVAAALLAAFVLFAPATSHAQSTGPLLRVVAVTGDPSPDGDGTLNFFQTPSINVLGDVGFGATFAGSFNPAGVLVERSTGLEVVARSNDPAPDGNGVLFSFQSVPIALNASGRVSFVSSLFGTAGGFTDTPRIFTADGTTLRQVVSKGQPAPDGNGTFDSFNAIGIEDDGDATFWAQFAGTSGGFTVDDRGVYRGDGVTDLFPAPLDEIIRSGETVGTMGLVAGNIDPLLVGSHPDGWVAVGAFVTNSPNPPTDSFVLVVDDGVSAPIRLTAGDPSPDGDGTIAGWSTPYVGADGRVASNVIFDGSDGGLADNMGVASFDLFGNDRVLVREGDSLPGGEVFAVDFEDAAGLASTLVSPNRYVFHAFLNFAPGGTLADEGLFLAADGAITEIVREGDAAPPNDDGEFDLLRLNLAHVNAAGTVVFFALVRNSTVLGNGLFRWSPTTGLVSIARVGQPLLGSTIQAVFLPEDVEARIGGVSPINAFGELTFRVRLQDGREAIIATSGVPEPGLVVGLVVGALTLAGGSRSRRRVRNRRLGGSWWEVTGPHLPAPSRCPSADPATSWRSGSRASPHRR